MCNLKQFARKCLTKSLTTNQHNDLLICDAFIAGIYLPTIRQRLLESTEDNLDVLYKTALTMELATEDALNLTTTMATTILPNFSATKNQAIIKPCIWCGGKLQQKTKCPARNSNCQRKGHWSKTEEKYYIKTSVINEKYTDDEDESTILSSAIAAINSPGRLIDVNKTQALLDTCSDKKFITSDLLMQWNLTYTTQCTNTYALMHGVYINKIKSVSTKSQRGKNIPFLTEEISCMLKQNIIQVSHSPWHAQCFVVASGHKNHLVIDYSNAINLHMPLDSYPTPRINNMLLKMAANKVFSTIDLKSAYHQVKIWPEVNGRLYEFTIALMQPKDYLWLEQH